MKVGLHDEGSLTLRLKMDFESANPNMYDLVAYRIKYTPHPHAGKGWCIYPNYDFTHGICDSLERIDYSICTLEFETRREPYYWILWALDMFRPKVYEMSRLNLEYTVLSKRRLLKLVDANYVRGWSDPRMPTISGLRRRGYTKDIINTFCNDVGATRAMNVVQMDKLFQVARQALADTTRRAMVALDPIKVVICNFAELAANAGDGGMTFDVQNSPTDASLGSHTVTLTETMYIDSEDFRLDEDPNFYRLTPGKPVGLKYHGGNLVCNEVINDGMTVMELKCHLDISEGRPKPKAHITWVPSDGIVCEVRIYNHLFTEPEPSDRWDEELNPESEIVHPNAIVDPSVLSLVDKKDVDNWKSNQALQFERLGYFVVDVDTSFDSTTKEGRLVFNRTVSLKEDKAVKKVSDIEAELKRKREEQQRSAAAARDILMTIEPEELFKLAPEYEGKYSKYDDTGLPTHFADGTELTKSAKKKLEKERAKHAKKFTKTNK
jgi:glutaminyl-tRNA synthetase